MEGDRAVGHRRHDEQVGDVAVQNGTACAVKDGTAVVTVAPAPVAADGSTVARTGSRERSDLFSAEQSLEQSRTLLFVTGAQHRLDRERRGRQRNWRQCPAEFGEHDGGLDQRAAGSAVLERDVQSWQLQLAAQSLPEPVVMAGGCAHRSERGGVTEKAAQRCTEVVLFCAVTEIHVRQSVLTTLTAGRRALGSLGSPSSRSPITLRWICELPA